MALENISLVVLQEPIKLKKFINSFSSGRDKEIIGLKIIVLDHLKITKKE